MVKTPKIDAADVPHETAAAGEDTGLFIFDARPTIADWPVTVKKPGPGGTVLEHKIRMDFAYIDAPALQQLYADLADWVAEIGTPGNDGHIPAGAPGDEDDPLLDMVLGWSGIGSEGKGALAYSEANKRLLLADNDVRQGVLAALNRIIMRLEEKNSETPPGAGQAPTRRERRAIAKRLAKGMA